MVDLQAGFEEAANLGVLLDGLNENAMEAGRFVPDVAGVDGVETFSFSSVVVSGILIGVCPAVRVLAAGSATAADEDVSSSGSTCMVLLEGIAVKKKSNEMPMVRKCRSGSSLCCVTMIS